MPVSSLPLHQITLYGGDQSTVTLTTGGVDAELVSCATSVSLLSKLSVVKAWVEVRLRATNTFAGVNNIVSGTVSVSSDNGGTFPTSALTFANAVGFSLASLNAPSYCVLASQTDISADVKAAVAGGFDLKYKIVSGTAAQNNLVLYDVSIALHLLVV